MSVDHYEVLMSRWVKLPDSGDYSVDEWFSERLGDYTNHLALVLCPYCRKFHKPFTVGLKHYFCVEWGWRWVGLEYQEPYSRYFARCRVTGLWFQFTTHAPQ
jgi:hypothetical protein